MDAVILAGGLGTRLRSVVSNVPKCMAPVGSRPFLSVILDQLAGCGEIDRVVLSVGYLREVIFDYLKDAEYPFEIEYAVEETSLGTGGGIKMALGLCRSEKVLILNGDTYFNVDIQKLLADAADAAITVALKPMKDFDRYGAVSLSRQGFITGFFEKRHCDQGLINGGVYLVNTSLFHTDGYGDRFSFEKDVLEPMAGGGMLRGSVQDGYFIDIGIPDDYAVAQLRWGGWKNLFLDRDGVINTLIPGDYVKKWTEFEFRPRFLEIAGDLAARFRHIIVVTNQRGVSRGVMGMEDLEQIHRRMVDEISGAGGRIDAVYCCTAEEDSDPRRKPNTGMWDDIIRDFPDVSAQDSVMLGDSDSDMVFARNCGIYGIKVNW